MYHPRIIQQRVEKATVQIRTGMPGFEVKRLSVSQAQAWEERLKLRKGKELTSEEQNHILSELVMAMPLWPAQEVIVRQFGELEMKIQEGGHEDGIMTQILKSRQQGITTLCA